MSSRAGLGEFDGDALFGQALAELVELEIDDPFDLVQREGGEQDDVVDPVEELRPEVVPQLAHDGGAGLGLDFAVGGDPVEQMMRTDVGRHDDHRVAEVDGAALRVGDAAVVEHLQQGVEDIRCAFSISSNKTTE